MGSEPTSGGTLQDLYDPDLESQGASEGSSSFITRIFTNRDRSNANSKAGSTKTSSLDPNGLARSPTNTINLRRRWTTFSGGSSHTAVSLKLDLEPAKTEFLDAITGPDSRSDYLCQACDWYTAFLLSRFRLTWDTAMRPVLAGTCGTNCAPCAPCIEMAYGFLKAVVSEFDKKDLALVEIVDALYNNEILKDVDGINDEDRLGGTQLAFAALGWISLLYTPDPNPRPSLLGIFDPFDARTLNYPKDGKLIRHRNRRQKPKTYTRYEQKVSDDCDQPLYTMLKKFGAIIPQRDPTTRNEHPSRKGTRDDRWIDLQLVCFEIIHKVASVNIEWVDSLSLHLEFDSSTKNLKIFRFPSLCFLMCSPGDRTILSKLFQNSTSGIESSTTTDTDNALQFFKEVLLSYRLIFGQTTSSRKHFNKQTKKWGLKLLENADPMLIKICGHSYDSEEVRDIYDEIGADNPSNHYNPDIEFPFLGRRLAIIQDYVRVHSPTSFWALWYDRRDVSWWWTFWAVIIIGSLGLLLGFAQVVLQILQLMKS